MQYIHLTDDIDELNLRMRTFYGLKRNGVNTVQDMIRSKENNELKDFAWLGKGNISEIEQLVNSLYSGDGEYIIVKEPPITDH